MKDLLHCNTNPRKIILGHWQEDRILLSPQTSLIKTPSLVREGEKKSEGNCLYVVRIANIYEKSQLSQTKTFLQFWLVHLAVKSRNNFWTDNNNHLLLLKSKKHNSLCSLCNLRFGNTFDTFNFLLLKILNKIWI